MNNQSNMPRRGTRRVVGAAITVAVIAVVLVINILFSFLADRFMWQVDSTVTKYTSRPEVSMYTPTEEFLKVVRDYAIPMVQEMNAERIANGEEPITINVKFCTERDKVYAIENVFIENACRELFEIQHLLQFCFLSLIVTVCYSTFSASFSTDKIEGYFCIAIMHSKQIARAVYLFGKLYSCTLVGKLGSGFR